MDKDSGKTQGLWTHNNHGKQHQVRSKSNTDGDEWTDDRKQEGPYKGVETQGKGRQSLTILLSDFIITLIFIYLVSSSQYCQQ